MLISTCDRSSLQLTGTKRTFILSTCWKVAVSVAHAENFPPQSQKSGGPRSRTPNPPGRAGRPPCSRSRSPCHTSARWSSSPGRTGCRSCAAATRRCCPAARSACGCVPGSIRRPAAAPSPPSPGTSDPEWNPGRRCPRRPPRRAWTPCTSGQRRASGSGRTGRLPPGCHQNWSWRLFLGRFVCPGRQEPLFYRNLEFFSGEEGRTKVAPRLKHWFSRRQARIHVGCRRGQLLNISTVAYEDLTFSVVT